MSVTDLAFALYGRRAGLITRRGGTITLTYDPAYRQPDAAPLSLSMPLVQPTWRGRQVEAYLAGLLPDRADVRTRWAAEFDVRPGDTLGLIAAIGADTAGAAVFAAPDDLDDVLAAPGGMVPATDADIAARLRRLRADESDWLDDDEHWSLAGAQGKFTVLRTDGGWAFPTGSTPSTHIVKPGITRITGQALAEHVSMRTLAALGIDVAPTEHVMVEDQSAIVMGRYDRRRARDGSLQRLHQEDVLQALGLDPRRKYEQDRGPGVARIVRLLRDSAGEDSVRRFVDATIVGYLIGAPDGHAKNYSLLLVGGTARLAPLYDVSTGLVPDSGGRLRYRSAAMSIGGEKRFGEVEGRHWDKFAGVVGMPAQDVRDRVQDLATRLPDALADAVRPLPDSPDARHLRARTVPAVLALVEQTLRGLTESRHVGGRVVSLWMDGLGDSAPESWDGQG
ncbi:type II toxin-antitoxin system HipA family toxin [Cellulomonas oligotrophica]|uniref:HipA domain-containing protein n=1 Tax=Cellulomonas oligotrophica TaxID=931536 RepID=A0A7Y9FHB8_9CELL|nr:type II toxin-antitoxin system HipA family toxin [Cellulomonas oligotrophica]NYD87339.1 serine/threonine-protein kinase HipA [Cellulomonas oligotrophica]GIG34258.1 HipA domain-containing protein [Cellulomonas oligotrophica]